ncbi:MAG TPA: COR domain-containing protein [Verrucomicrobiales bacterium]|nr:COR domain-containing protein [Verrucomicrobiales bacterium]
MLYLHGNPALGLTDEVLGPEDYDSESATPPRRILAAWRALQRGGRRALNEAKVILVGRGGAGKTTLRKAMMKEAIPDKEDRTDGIELSRFDLKVGEAEVGLNVWDFGGQEVMYSTHRFFLTSRSLYLLVLDARSGPQDENVDYWLRVVEELGKGPPVLVVLNHVDENRGLSLDETGWKAKYPFIAGFVRTCAKTREGLQELLDKMSGVILTHLPEARADFPAAWFSVKDKLTEMKEKLGRDHLKMEEYEQLCVEEKIPEDERFPLLCLVRDLGLVSCYPEVLELKDLGVLRPDWLTDGIYSLITNETLKQKGGHIRLGEVPQYLRGDRQRYRGYERFLLDAAKHFRLGFQVPHSDDWLLTALLDENTPEGLTDWQTAEGLKLEMRYRVLPEGLVAQFIAAAHLLGQDAKLRRWRNGTELRMDGATALVQGDVPARHIRILVQGLGHSARPLLACIRQHFRAINAGLTPPDEFVPVPNLDAEPVKYSDLLAREAKGRATMEVIDRNGDLHDVDVAPMLDRYVAKDSRMQEIAERKRRAEEEPRAGRNAGGADNALTLWREKLVTLQKAEAIAVDADEKFRLTKQIEEAKGKIDEYSA